ncbi:MAG: response regulator, partial [Chthoniobacterales bacterium]
QHVIIQFADNGVGIDPEVLPRIFNAFEQGGRTTTTKYGGLGLGLAISKSIIDAHEGQITAESGGRDGGAAFTITLQAIATSLLDGPAYVLAPRGRTAAGRRVLLVEDHDDTARVLRRILEHAGYEVALAATVAEARECGANQQFDLLISDIGLSDGSGLDLMRELRATTAIEGIALSGFGTEDDVAASRAAGFAEHLTKPIGWERLRGAIERIVSGAPAEQQDELSPA